MTEEVPDTAEAHWAADYSAAQRACSKCLHGEEGDLRPKLDDALKSGWSIQALKAYAFSVWQLRHQPRRIRANGNLPIPRLVSDSRFVIASAERCRSRDCAGRP
jgi:hypothetical protein